MKSQPDPDKLVQELAAVRALIHDHANVQQLLDFAADEAERRAVAQERLRRSAWHIAAAFGGIAFIACVVAGGAVATAMRPLPPPEILVVDRADGVVQPLISLADFQMAPEEATIRRNINTFVLAREGYSYEQADTHYYTSAAFMSPQLQIKWAEKWDRSNPEALPKKFRREQRLRIKVGAITILRNGLGTPIGARASFTRTELVNDAEQGQQTAWIANISFHWVNQPANERDRRINDLGMEVTDYSVDQDLGARKPEPAVPPARTSQSEPVPSPMALTAPRATQQVTP